MREQAAVFYLSEVLKHLIFHDEKNCFHLRIKTEINDSSKAVLMGINTCRLSSNLAKPVLQIGGRKNSQQCFSLKSYQDFYLK